MTPRRPPGREGRQAQPGPGRGCAFRTCAPRMCRSSRVSSSRNSSGSSAKSAPPPPENFSSTTSAAKPGPRRRNTRWREVVRDSGLERLEEAVGLLEIEARRASRRDGLLGEDVRVAGREGPCGQAAHAPRRAEGAHGGGLEREKAGDEAAFLRRIEPAALER